jgi:hypothetical protein
MMAKAIKLMHHLKHVGDIYVTWSRGIGDGHIENLSFRFGNKHCTLLFDYFTAGLIVEATLSNQIRKEILDTYTEQERVRFFF